MNLGNSIEPDAGQEPARSKNRANAKKVISPVQKLDLIKRIWLDRELSHMTKLVGIILVDLTNDEFGYAFARMDTIEASSGISKSTVVKATAELERKGWFNVVRSRNERTGKNAGNNYFPNLKMIEERSGKLVRKEAGERNKGEEVDFQGAYYALGQGASGAPLEDDFREKAGDNDFQGARNALGQGARNALGQGARNAPYPVNATYPVNTHPVNEGESNTPSLASRATPPSLAKKEEGPPSSKATTPQAEWRIDRAPSAKNSVFLRYGWPADADAQFLAAYPEFERNDERFEQRKASQLRRELCLFAAADGKLKTLLDGAKAYAREVERLGTQPYYVAHPANWLSGKRWLDEYGMGMAAAA